jgi:hypothetical protein
MELHAAAGVPVNRALFACLLFSSAAAMAKPALAEDDSSNRYFVAGGADYRRIYDIGMFTGRLALAVGFEKRATLDTPFIGAAIQAGATLSGRTVFDYRLGAGYLWAIRRFRVGFEVDLGWLSVARVTSGASAKTLWLGISPIGSFDVVDLGEGRSLYVGARLEVDALGAAPSPAVWGPSLEVGIRF